MPSNTFCSYNSSRWGIGELAPCRRVEDAIIICLLVMSVVARCSRRQHRIRLGKMWLNNQLKPFLSHSSTVEENLLSRGPCSPFCLMVPDMPQCGTACRSANRTIKSEHHLGDVAGGTVRQTCFILKYGRRQRVYDFLSEIISNASMRGTLQWIMIFWGVWNGALIRFYRYLGAEIRYFGSK